MSDRERWVLYPLLFFSLVLGLRASYVDPWSFRCREIECQNLKVSSINGAPYMNPVAFAPALEQALRQAVQIGVQPAAASPATPAANGPAANGVPVNGVPAGSTAPGVLVPANTGPADSEPANGPPTAPTAPAAPGSTPAGDVQPSPEANVGEQPRG